MKRITSILLSGILIITSALSIPIYCFAETVGDWEYSCAGHYVGEAELVGYNGSDKELVLPTELDGNIIVGIDQYVFLDNTQITKVTIPNTYKYIGWLAFSGCTNLKEINLPSDLNSIGREAFEDCTSLSSVIIPDSVTEIEDEAFNGCTSLKKVSLGKNVQRIGSFAFGGCVELSDINIPNSVTSLDDAFHSCSKLKSIILPGEIGELSSWCFCLCTNLTNVTLCEGITKIGVCAFSHCYSLTSVFIPKSITKIGKSAFQGCDELSDIYYAGSEEEWELVVNESFERHEGNGVIHPNGNFDNANVIFNSSVSKFSNHITNDYNNSSFQLLCDNNKFIHSNRDRNCGFWNVKNYSLSSSKKDKLLKGLSKGEKKAFINKTINCAWGGSCYGIAATMGLAYLNKLPLVNDSSGGDYFSMGNPWKNKNFLDTIQYYHLTQYLNKYNRYSHKFFNPEKLNWINALSSSTDSNCASLSDFFARLLKTLKEDGIAQFSYSTSHSGHSILALGYIKLGDGSYKIKLYDENSFYGTDSNGNEKNGEFTYLTLSKDMSTFSFHDANEIYVNDEVYTCLSFYDFDDYQKGDSSSSGGLTNSTSYCLSMSPDNACYLTDSDGNKFSCYYGDFSTNMDISDVTASTNDTDVAYTFTINGKKSLTFNPVDGELDITLYDKNSFAALTANNVESAKINLSGKIEITGDNCTYNVVVGDEKTEEGVFDISAELDGTSKISFADNAVSVSSDTKQKLIDVKYVDGETTNELLGNASGTSFSIDSKKVCNHKSVTDKAITPTFKKAGKTKGAHCKLCGKILVKQKTIPKLKAANLSKVKKGKNSFTASWKKVKSVDGYQVQYSTGKKFKKGKNTITKTVKGAKKTKLTVKKLTPKKTYYVQIRAYKVINGKKIYSKWSKSKKVTIK